MSGLRHSQPPMRAASQSGGEEPQGPPPPSARSQWASPERFRGVESLETSGARKRTSLLRWKQIWSCSFGAFAFPQDGHRSELQSCHPADSEASPSWNKTRAVGRTAPVFPRPGRVASQSGRSTARFRPPCWSPGYLLVGLHPWTCSRQAVHVSPSEEQMGREGAGSHSRCTP
jgi:hypothetical protein